MHWLESKLSNLPFQLKFLLAPLIAIVLMATLSYHVTRELQRTQDSTAYIVDHNMEAVALLSDVRFRAQGLDSEIYRLLTAQATSPLPASELETRLGQIKTRAQRITAMLTAYRDKFANDAQKKTIDETLANIQKVSEGVDVIGSMLEIDFASAASFVAPFNTIFTSLAASIDVLNTDALTDSRRRSEAASVQAQNTAGMALQLTLGALLIIALSGWVIGRSTTLSIRRIATATLELAHGERALDVESLRRRDELSTIVGSLETFAHIIDERQRLSREREVQELNAKEERRNTLSKLANDFELYVNSTVSSVADAATHMTTAAQSMSSVAQRTSGMAQAAAVAANSATANVTTVATASEELAQSINEISRQVTQASNTSATALEKTEMARRTVNDLTEAAARIGEVVKLITAIAAQTNLLALNATIEAARAGEHGKGFAVVAGEVKALSNQTAAATGEISQQIASVQAATRHVVNAIEQIVDTIDDINSISAAIASAVEEQQAATREIARNVEEARSETATVAANVDGVLNGATESNVSASDVLGAATTLGETSSTLQRQVQEFVARVLN